MPGVEISDDLEYDRNNRPRIERKPGLIQDLDVLNKQLGTLSQAITALNKVLDPITSPETPVAELPSNLRTAGDTDTDVNPIAPLRGKVDDLCQTVISLTRRIERMAERVEL
jgi:hypothetical protein